MSHSQSHNILGYGVRGPLLFLCRGKSTTEERAIVMEQRSTKQVAELLGIPPGRLARAVWDRRVAPPGKGPGGDYQWTLDDIRRASWALLRRDYKAGGIGGQV